MAGIVLGQTSFEFGPCSTLQDLQEQLIDLQEALGGPAGPPGEDGELVLQPVYVYDDPVDGPIIVSPPTDGSDPGDINNYVTNITVEGGGGGGTSFTADAGLVLTGSSLTTDNDTATHLGYTGSGATQKNAILWEDINEFDEDEDQVLIHESGTRRWATSSFLQVIVP